MNASHESAAGKLTISDLADVAVEISGRALPAVVAARACRLIADGLVVTALGARSAEHHALRAVLPVGSGSATVLGTSDTASVDTALALNAIAQWRYQLQEGHRLARGHPGSVVLPALLAMAEEVDAGFSRFLTSFVVGYEVGVRAAASLGGTPSGVHDLGSWGPLGTAAAVATLLTDDPAGVHAAIAGAASMLLMTDADAVFIGSVVQHLYLPAASSLGIAAARFGVVGLGPAVEADGVPLCATLLERAAGTGTRQVPPPPVVDDASTFAILDGYVKLHPVCGLLHSAVDAAVLTHRRLTGRSREEITDIRVHVHPAAMKFGVRRPRNDLEARFSLPFAVAYALHNGHLWSDPDPQLEQALSDPYLLHLADRVQAICLADPRGQRPARIEVHFKDGSRERLDVSRALGDGDDERARSLIDAKRNRLAGILFADRAGPLSKALNTLVQGDVGPRQLGALFREAATDGA